MSATAVGDDTSPAAAMAGTAAAPIAAGAVETVIGTNDRGEPVISVVVKRSYRLRSDGALERAGHDEPLHRIDEYHDHGDPLWATVRHEAELVAMKAAVDVVVIGRAHAPRGELVAEMGVAVRVGDRVRRLRVIGERQAFHRANGHPGFTEPTPFRTMDIRYEHAYGGVDEQSIPERPFHYPRNTHGCGVVTANSSEALDGLPLPTVEDPADLLVPERLVLDDPADWPELPRPAGFGWLHRTWYPRCALLGAFPAWLAPGRQTAEEREGLLPADHVALAMQYRLPTYRSRFANGASRGLVFDRLADDAAIRLEGLHRDGTLAFALPGERPRVSLDIGGGARELLPKLDTVVVRPDELAVELIWRAPFEIGDYGELSRLSRLRAEVDA